jgi:hypothetical protein
VIDTLKTLVAVAGIACFILLVAAVVVLQRLESHPRRPVKADGCVVCDLLGGDAR